jgi:hypothetical protein
MQADLTLHLGYMCRANGTHPAGWRYPGALVNPRSSPVRSLCQTVLTTR